MTAHRNLIGGDWVGGSEAANLNPSDTEDVIGLYAQADAEQAACAVAAAGAAAPAWARTPPEARGRLLAGVAREIAGRAEALADLLSREEGKTLREARAEVARAAAIFEFFAGEAIRPHGQLVDSVRPGVEVLIDREPVGVVSVITPWNFPLAIPAWKIAPALAFGNCVVLKPAELTPGCAWALAEILAGVGIPPGVFNLVMGRGAALGETLVGPGVDALSFTGSVPVGRALLARAAAHGVKAQLEMGGKNPLLVLADADLDLAAAAALDGAYFATGQRCTASSRLIVEDRVHDAFVERLLAGLAQQVVGDARDPATTIGPVVDARQLAADLRHIEAARAEGAALAFGGEPLTRPRPGHYLSPALFVGTTPDMRINREEVFGPVAAVIRVSDYEEGLRVANDTEFGLCAGICTRSLRHATDFRRRAAAGMVMVNLPTAGVDPHVPFGGRKASSHGPREQGAAAVEFYTHVKTAYVRAG